MPCHWVVITGYAAVASRPRGETEYLGVEGYRGFQPRLANKRGHNDLIACIIYLENSGRYVTAGRDGIVCVWDETEKNKVRCTADCASCSVPRLCGRRVCATRP